MYSIKQIDGGDADLKIDLIHSGNWAAQNKPINAYVCDFVGAKIQIGCDILTFCYNIALSGGRIS